MYEHHSSSLLPVRDYYHRLLKNFLWGIMIITCSLFMGILGYHFFEDMEWIDAMLNASMILAGMGPVAIIKTSGGKLFASFYALFSGVVFLTSIAFILTPVAHRFLHKFHLDQKN